MNKDTDKDRDKDTDRDKDGDTGNKQRSAKPPARTVQQEKKCETPKLARVAEHSNEMCLYTLARIHI